eukprot:1185125-Prorocentrum_minimum.AAC.1
MACPIGATTGVRVRQPQRQHQLQCGRAGRGGTWQLDERPYGHVPGAPGRGHFELHCPLQPHVDLAGAPRAEHLRVTKSEQK